MFSRRTNCFLKHQSLPPCMIATTCRPLLHATFVPPTCKSVCLNSFAINTSYGPFFAHLPFVRLICLNLISSFPLQAPKQSRFEKPDQDKCIYLTFILLSGTTGAITKSFAMNLPLDHLPRSFVLSSRCSFVVCAK
ncbi:hypothetical protein D9M68_826780 [compost metagenome]